MSNAELMSIRRLLEAQVDSHYADAANAAMAAAAWTTFALTATSADADAIPDQDCRFCLAAIYLDTIAGGAANVEWFLSQTAAAPYQKITPRITTAIDFDAVVPGALGSVCAVLGGGIGVPYRRVTGLGLQGTVYLLARVTAGTANGAPVLWFTAKTPYPVYPLND